MFVSCPGDDSFSPRAFLHPEGGTPTSPGPPGGCDHPLQGRRLRVSAFGVAPYVILGRDGTVRGVDPDVISMLARKFGFSFDVSWGRFFGAKDPETGEWTGLVGQVNYSN